MPHQVTSSVSRGRSAGQGQSTAALPREQGKRNSCPGLGGDTRVWAAGKRGQSLQNAGLKGCLSTQKQLPQRQESVFLGGSVGLGWREHDSDAKVAPSEVGGSSRR